MLINGVNFDNTLEVKKLAAKGIPAIPVGKETQLYQVGETHTCSPFGLLKAGIPFKIVEAYQQNGYWYYRDESNMVHRTKDII